MKPETLIVAILALASLGFWIVSVMDVASFMDGSRVSGWAWIVAFGLTTIAWVIVFLIGMKTFKQGWLLLWFGWSLASAIYIGMKIPEVPKTIPGMWFWVAALGLKVAAEFQLCRSVLKRSAS
jgi:hypothetical protein